MIPAPPHNFRQRFAGERPKRLLGWCGDGSAVLEHPTDDLETFHIVPAQPGWFVLTWWADADAPDDERVGKTAIVAWKISITSSVSYADNPWTASWTLPVTADCCDWREMPHWVLGPDGLVYRFDEVPQPFERWLEWQQKQLTEKREKPELKVAA
jgi:hypothetical protein